MDGTPESGALTTSMSGPLVSGSSQAICQDQFGVVVVEVVVGSSTTTNWSICCVVYRQSGARAPQQRETLWGLPVEKGLPDQHIVGVFVYVQLVYPHCPKVVDLYTYIPFVKRL